MNVKNNVTNGNSSASVDNSSSVFTDGEGVIGMGIQSEGSDDCDTVLTSLLSSSDSDSKTWGTDEFADNSWHDTEVPVSGNNDIGLPNPNTPVNVGVSNHADYSEQSSGGARIVNGVDVNRSGMMGMPVQGSQNGQSGQGVQNAQNVQGGQNMQSSQVVQTVQNGQYVQNTQNVQGVHNNQNVQGGQPVQNMQPGQGAQNRQNVQNGQNGNNQASVNGSPNKKKSKLPLLLAVIGVVVVVGGILIFSKKGKDAPNEQNAQVEAEVDYTNSGRNAYDLLLNALNEYNPEKLDALIGLEDADSYLAQEWAYVNGVKIREEFLQKVGSLVRFEYPMVEKTSSDGTVTKVESQMNNGESVTVILPDYSAITAGMDSNANIIKSMYKELDKNSYTYNDDMANILLQYILDYADIESNTTKAEIKLVVKKNNGEFFFEDDAELDKLLFSTPEFREMCAKFSQICVGFTGFKDEYYTSNEQIHNPEYDTWKVVFDEYYNADGGKFTKGVSKWEPWFLRDENNVIQKDENGENIVNYYSVKAADGTDWVQPDEVITIALEHVRQVEDTWVEETGVMYNWIGTWWIQNEYRGTGSTIFRVGDGTKDNPAGIGTPILTKVLCADGEYHDVRVTLLGYWVGDNAIEYCQKFSNKNRGFAKESTKKLITFEIQVENLENNTIVFEVSEMTLSDGNDNITSRTGTMYGFSEIATIKPRESIIINDWYNSLDIEQKYLIWGKTFNRQFQAIYFDALAGTGVVPEYSAYDQFVGKSVSESNMN